MADNFPLTPGAGRSAATDQVTYSGDTADVQLTRIVQVTGAEGSKTVVDLPGDATNGLDVDVTRLPALVAGTANIGDVDILTVNGQAPAFGSGARGATVQRVTVATDDVVQTFGAFVTCSTDVTRPANATQYAINDALADTTPTAGGFTFTSAARASGGSGIITDAIVVTDADAATLLQGEIFIFNQAVTAITDNAAFAITDAEAKTCIGKIPFTLEDIGNNGWFHATNLNIGFTCVGTANLRFLVRVKNTYTPVSGEVLTFIIKVLQVT